MPLVTLKNKVDPLTWNVPIANKDGTPTNEFQVKWVKQLTANASIPDLTSAAKVSGVLDLIGSGKGSILYRGTLQWNTLSGAAGHDGWVLTWNDATGLPEWRAVAGGGASSFFLDGTDGYMALVDSNGFLVLDSLGRGIYSKDPVLPAAMIPNPAGYVTGTYAATVVNKVKGVTDGSNAAAGDVGEFTSASLAAGSAINLNAAGTAADVVSISLPAGDWDVSGSLDISSSVNPTAIAFQSGWTSSTSATFPSPFPDTSFAQTDGHGLAPTGDTIFAVGTKRFSLAATTTIYLSARAAYTGGQQIAYGIIRARRVR